MNRTILQIATCALLALGACNKKSENPPPSAGTSGGAAMSAGTGSAAAGSAAAGSAAATGSAAAAGSAAGSGSAAAVDVPTPEDFEADATAKITDKNVEAQVKALETQLEQK
jgi:hypothetical protein